MQGQLKDFINSARSKNISDEEILKILLDQGWKLDQIQPLIFDVKTVGGLVPPKPTDVAVSSLGMWDSFQHILLFISLYIMATSIALILNFFVDKWFPGVSTLLYGYTAQDTYSSTIFSGYSAALIVSFPFFAFFFLETNKRKIQYPEIVNLKSRKVLIYFTLVMTFIIMISHLVAVVFQFLNGNVTLNAFLHFLVTIIVAGSIFAYYLYDIRHDRQKI